MILYTALSNNSLTGRSVISRISLGIYPCIINSTTRLSSSVNPHVSIYLSRSRYVTVIGSDMGATPCEMRGLLSYNFMLYVRSYCDLF